MPGSVVPAVALITKCQVLVGCNNLEPRYNPLKVEERGGKAFEFLEHREKRFVEFVRGTSETWIAWPGNTATRVLA